MTERKGTPDILGQILSGAASADLPPAPAPVQPSATVPVAPPQVTRAPRATASKQARWEYLVVSFHEQNGWHARFVNGHELENWTQGPQLHHVLDQLGEDGWELINVVKAEPLYGTMDRIQAFFKRVKL
jgi:hypothetical protein